ncbi:MAG TPA: Fe(3+)-hydroxamate ABC transporter permease FhuB, partial [Paraburkholderia sp.]|nr:Fe(3+)-hydroxamate ABC transporter permease FhuB [Paraburkholderia sp.]
MTTFAARKRMQRALPRWRGAQQSYVGVLAVSLTALLVIVAALRVAPDLSMLLHAPTSNAGHTGDDAALAQVLLFNLHVPRVLAAIVAGACLGMAGALFQALTRNPLASPDLLGITGGAQLGLLAAMLIPALAGMASVPLLFGCGLLAAACVAAAAGGWRATPLRMVLAGSVCMLLFSAVSTLTLAFFEQSIAGVALWASGSLYQPGGDGLLTAVLWLLLPLAALPFVVRPLDPISLGDDAALAVGVRVEAARFYALLVAVAFASVAVSIAGPMSYVGLIAPNLLRHLRGSRSTRLAALAPLSALVGALLVLATDSMVLALDLDGTLSTGVAIAVVGTPLMLAMIRHGGAWASALTHTTDAAAQTAQGRFAAWITKLSPFAVALIVAAVAAISIYAAGALGPTTLDPSRWLAALNGDDAVARMLLDLRLPRVVCALLAGAMLAASGVLMQSVVRNPLAGPEVLGVTQGASLATLVALLLWPLAAHATIALSSLIGGGVTLVAILALNRRMRYAPLAVALTGLVVGTLWTTLAQWVIVQESVQPARFVVWLVGGTYGRSWSDVLALLPWCAVALPAFVLLARPLDLLALGDDQA